MNRNETKHKQQHTNRKQIIANNGTFGAPIDLNKAPSNIGRQITLPPRLARAQNIDAHLLMNEPM